MNTLNAWKIAALLKDRTRREIRERARIGGKRKHLEIAEDFGVPVEFVDVVASWQMFEDDPAPLASPEALHRCSGCGHRWDGPLTGAELCGDCWRRWQGLITSTPADGPVPRRVKPPLLRGESSPSPSAGSPARKEP